MNNLKINQVITNSIAREVLGVDSKTARNIFKRLQKQKLIEIVPGTSRGKSVWRKFKDSNI